LIDTSNHGSVTSSGHLVLTHKRCVKTANRSFSGLLKIIQLNKLIIPNKLLL